MIRVIYEAPGYSPERVTGRYVRRVGHNVWRVFECASGSGRFAGKPGHGPTLREWDTGGEDLPENMRVTWNAGTVEWMD